MSDKPTRTLTLDEELNVQYCIPNWLRDEQIKINIGKVKGRIEPRYETRDEPIALVNFGPSLNDTWEQIRDYKYVMTCSGAHKFCVDHGITPTYHIDVDPRPHKIQLLGTPQKETEYLIASTCSPKLFDHLADYDLKLWHIFDNDENGFRLLPQNEWAITGGCSVGVRTITLARFLGFTDLHIFGMDGCLRESVTHAADHPNGTKSPCLLEYGGKEYATTPSMLAAAKNTWHELDMMKDTKATFYGDGLVQAMSRDYTRKETNASTLFAFSKPELISAEYRTQNEQLHADNLAYGVGGGKHADLVKKLVKNLSKNTDFVSVLDYGCGKGYLGKSLPFPIYEYDPAMPGKQESPKPADLVCCLDVLEHIEPDHLEFVLDDLRRCTKQIGLFVIHSGSSSKSLPDGRNAHLIQEGEAFWREKLGPFFSIPANGFFDRSPLLFFIASPKSAAKTMGKKLKAM